MSEASDGSDCTGDGDHSVPAAATPPAVATSPTAADPLSAAYRWINESLVLTEDSLRTIERRMKRTDESVSGMAQRLKVQEQIMRRLELRIDVLEDKVPSGNPPTAERQGRPARRSRSPLVCHTAQRSPSPLASQKFSLPRTPSPAGGKATSPSPPPLQQQTPPLLRSSSTSPQRPGVAATPPSTPPSYTPKVRAASVSPTRSWTQSNAKTPPPLSSRSAPKSRIAPKIRFPSPTTSNVTSQQVQSKFRSASTSPKRCTSLSTTNVTSSTTPKVRSSSTSPMRTLSPTNSQRSATCIPLSSFAAKQALPTHKTSSTNTPHSSSRPVSRASSKVVKRTLSTTDQHVSSTKDKQHFSASYDTAVSLYKPSMPSISKLFVSPANKPYPFKTHTSSAYKSTLKTASNASSFSERHSVASTATCLFRSRKTSFEEMDTLLGRQLMKASEEGKVEIVRRLLEDGAPANYCNNFQWSPLHKAALKAHVDVIKLLLRRGADVNMRTAHGYTALHMAARHDRTGRCVSLLLNAGCSVDPSNEFRRTPLHYAAEAGNKAAVRVLVAAGACKYVTDNKRRSPIDVAKSSQIRQLLSIY